MYDDVEETELYWVPGGPDVPRGAVTAGDLEDGTSVYVVRIYHIGAAKYVPGSYRTTTGYVEYEFGPSFNGTTDWFYLVLKYDSKYSRIDTDRWAV